ncbi:hypothetical protein M5362_12775 [Streptomyces sp. Je 1-79]|uniref:hypothetical protein n=1 Tax=Streptomyces sp. Je 1-79 TaxID=2943847 RepID=UPI0021A390B1|nr:hypothetical protein [Streptomyces sp. Je 1-79]MCT4354004.1 hypothetical protein [Streptomyces sp. Je 1-79]
MSGTLTAAPAELRRLFVEWAGPVGPADEGAAVAAGATDDSVAVARVRSTRPARRLAASLSHALPPTSAAAVLLSELTERHLAGSEARWRRLHDALTTSPDTLPELLAALPEPSEVAADRLPPTSVCDTMALLLEQARPAYAAAALTALPDRTLETILAGGSLPGPSLTSAVLLHGDSRSRTALARHPRIDARVLKQLVAADDPKVNAAVYRNNRCTPSLRRTVVHAHARGHVALEDALRAELLSSAGAASRSRTAPLLVSGDPPLVTQALTWGVRKVAQRHALLRVLECRGADAVRTMLADPAVVPHVHPVIRAEIADALEGADATLRLRAAGEPYEDPAVLPRLLGVSRGTSTLRDLLNEPYTHDFRALASANRTSPFMPKAAEELLRHEDATDVERAEFRLTLLNGPWRAGGRVAGNLTPPHRRLAEEPLDESAAEWAVGVVEAGLLDPAELVTTARPAARAAEALRAVADRDLDTGTARNTLTALYEENLAASPEAVATLLRNLPGHPGTLREAVREAGAEAARAAATVRQPTPSRTDAGTDVPRAGSVPTPDAEPPAGPPQPVPDGGVGLGVPSVPPTPLSEQRGQEPVGERARAALGAIDLLRSLAVPGTAPLPDDPVVLRRLAAHTRDDVPGRRHPDWLYEACLAQGLNDLAHRCRTPTRADALARMAETPEAGSLARIAEPAYLHGIVRADDLLHHLPAAHLLRLPHDWAELAFPAAWRRSLATFLERELGTDADAWLRLAATARRSMEAADDAGTGRPAGPTWPELLDRSRLDTHRAADTVAEARAPLGHASTFAPTEPPTSPESAVRLLARGNHLWAWPLGTLLCVAGPVALAAVMARVGPDGPWMLAAFVLRSRATERTPFAYLVDHRDRAALTVLSEQSRWLDPACLHRLLDLADPDVDLAVLRGNGDPELCRRVAVRPGVLAPRLAAELRADPLAELPGGRTPWLESAEPDLIELVFDRAGKHLTAAQQLVGALNLLRHGGPRRLAALAESGRLGAAATRLCQKALASDDPDSVLAARAAKELAPERLAKRLRKSRTHAQTRSLLDSTPGTPDWEALEAEHARDPLPSWVAVVRHPTAPRDFRIRNAEHLHRLSALDVSSDREVTVARARHGVGGYGRGPVDALLDHLLRTGRLTGRDLVREAAPAAVVLSYLGRARRRSDAPEEVGVALGEVARLVAERLGDDPDAWRGVHARLTDPAVQQTPARPTPELLSGP